MAKKGRQRGKRMSAPPLFLSAQANSSEALNSAPLTAEAAFAARGKPVPMTLSHLQAWSRLQTGRRISAASSVSKGRFPLASSASRSSATNDDFTRLLHEELQAFGQRIQEHHERCRSQSKDTSQPVSPAHSKSPFDHLSSFVSPFQKLVESSAASPNPFDPLSFSSDKLGNALQSVPDLDKLKEESVTKIGTAQSESENAPVISAHECPAPLQEDRVASASEEEDEESSDDESVASVSLPNAIRSSKISAGGNGQKKSVIFEADAKPGDTEFQLLDAWQIDKTELEKAASTALHTLDFDTDSGDESTSEAADDDLASISWKSRTCQYFKALPAKLLINPNSKGKVLWDFIAFLLVLLDCIFIPLAFFDVYYAELSWLTRCFWTMDLPISFFTTHVLQDDKLELNPYRVFRKNIRSMIFKDLPLVMIDWVDYFVGNLGAAKLSKIVKAIRMMRLLRLWRLINSKELPESVRATIHYYFSSEIGLTVLSILKLLCVVMWVNHVLACCWYEVANQTADDGRNWVKAADLSDASTAYLYVTALHWSIAQFFCGSSRIGPENLPEASFSVGVLFCTIMMSASIISSLTTSMTRLSIAAAEETKKIAVLREYLSQNNISARTSLRVQRNALYSLHELRRNTPEHDVELLALVSQPLMIELHFEMSMPWLRNHPFFERLAEEGPDLVRRLCHEAVSAVPISHGDLLFSQGVTNVRHMYFLIAGKLLYGQTKISGEMFLGHTRHWMNVGDWACEPVLWTTWSHVGSVRAKAESKIVVLTSETFRAISLDFKAALPYVSNYADRYVRWLNKLPQSEHTDLAHPDCDHSRLADQARRRDASIAARRMTRRISVHQAVAGGVQGLPPAFLAVTPDGEDESHSADSEVSASEKRSSHGSRVHPEE